MTGAATDNVSLVRSAYEAFERGDVDAVVGLMDDSIEWYESEGSPWYPGHPLQGPQQVADAVLNRLGQSYKDFRIEVDRVLGDGDTVVMLGRHRATKAFATGRPLNAQVAHVWDLRDGKVVRFQEYTDTRQLARVLGA